MKVIIAKHSGFCTGVDRAYRTAIETAKKGVPVYILGLLVHNSQVINKLEEMGVRSINDLEDINVGVEHVQPLLIISAHGVGPEKYEQAKKMGLKIIDTTCPWVKKAQRLAGELYNSGYKVVIIGDKNHTEVKGIMGWTQDCAVVVENEKDAEQLPCSEKIGVVAQTTQSVENFNSVIAKLKMKAGEIKIYNTICDATSKMQQDAVDVAKMADIMLVIGDKRSANTKRLRELCSGTGVETHQIESFSELDMKWLKSKNTAGITAGASTPDWVINEIVNKING
jgi:4-hydroxy-3-methylbut-2-enyl diphosphate reductase